MLRKVYLEDIFVLKDLNVFLQKWWPHLFDVCITL